MKLFTTLYVFLCMLFATQTIHAQELRCRVMVQYSDIPNADKDFFNDMRSTIEEFMNTNVWTNMTFEEHEKIDLRLNIRVTKQLSNKNFTATLQIQSNRPVYNATYTSSMFNHVDEQMTFEFEENQSIEFSENSFISNLSSILAFYTYIILGIDADSFQMQGGTAYYQKAQQIATAATSYSDTEWGASSNKKNKYWLVENILNTTYSGFRSALYLYHRQGLDIMAEKPADGRKYITQALEELEQVHKVSPGAFLLSVFFYAKKTELISIYSEAMPDEKKHAADLLKRLNPANVSDYDKLLKE